MIGNLRLRSGAIDWRQIEDEIVAVQLDTASYMATNGSGALLWPALLQGTTRAELAAQLVDAYGISVDRAAADVDAFLQILREHQLLEDGS